MAADNEAPLYLETIIRKFDVIHSMSSLDLRSGFHQIELVLLKNPENATLNFYGELYQFKMVSFRLKRTMATLIRNIRNVLVDDTEKYTECFVYDLINVTQY